MRFVNIGELLPDGTLREVRIFEFDAQLRLSRLLEARGASWGRGNGWELREVEEIRFTEVPAVGLGPAVGTRRATATVLQWQTELRPEILGVLLVEPDRMSGLNLYSYIRHLRENAQNTSQYEIAF